MIDSSSFETAFANAESAIKKCVTFANTLAGDIVKKTNGNIITMRGVARVLHIDYIQVTPDLHVGNQWYFTPVLIGAMNTTSVDELSLKQLRTICDELIVRYNELYL